VGCCGSELEAAIWHCADYMMQSFTIRQCLYQFSLGYKMSIGSLVVCGRAPMIVRHSCLHNGLYRRKLYHRTCFSGSIHSRPVLMRLSNRVNEHGTCASRGHLFGRHNKSCKICRCEEAALISISDSRSGDLCARSNPLI
jgi:hypothetical protein